MDLSIVFTRRLVGILRKIGKDTVLTTNISKIGLNSLKKTSNISQNFAY